MTLTRSNENINSTKELRELIHRASAVIAHYWPMTTFVHHNPIRSLEFLQFEEAVRVARRFIKGRGYLPNEQYRRLVESGRIKYEHLDAAIRSVAGTDELELAGRKISQFDVFKAHMLIGITAPSDETVVSLVDRASISGNALALVQGPSQNALVPPDLPLSGTHIRELSKRIEVGSGAPERLTSEIGTAMTLLTWCDRTFHTHLDWLVNKELIKWCSAFLDEGHAAWPMPYREKGFYEAWRNLAVLEWSPCGIADCARKIRALPASAEEAVISLLDALAIPAELRQDYLSLHLSALYGWAGFINWRAEQSNHKWQSTYPIDLAQYLAVRLFYEKELVDQTCRTEAGIEGKFVSVVSHLKSSEEKSAGAIEAQRLASAWRLTMLAGALKLSTQEITGAETRLLQWLDDFPETEHGPVWLKAYEAGYHQGLIEKLHESASKSKSQADNAPSSRPHAQAMFCIDVRSEPFRRHLELVGNYETIGFAGFFGIPIRCRAFEQYHETDQVPAIVQPKYTVHEVTRQNQTELLARHKSGAGFLYTIQEMIHDMKHHVLTPYIMVESLGWLFGFQLFGRTLFPLTYRKWQSWFKKKIAPPVGTRITVDRDENNLGLTNEEQSATIETVLRMMGLTKNFARLVAVCGHTSMSDNNPYEAALNCGACGGNSGKPNARLLAAMANKPHVREHLAKNGIMVPEDTHFIGGVHNTTTDEVELFDLEDLPETHKEDLERLKADLHQAKLRTNVERCNRLPGAVRGSSLEHAAKEVARRAGDWSETRPEWGLAGNAAFIIGDRALTKNIDLEGRAFLNSHDYRIDSTGALLEGIIMGPMVVGQWINAEHYFSATDTEIYGSGSKIYHNVVGRIGIMSGPQSDLRTGLAWQSMMNGELPYHEPLRLLVVIEAPRERIHSIVERQPILKQLCDNEWIHLVAIDYEGEEPLYRYQAKKGWVPVRSGETAVGLLAVNHV